MVCDAEKPMRNIKRRKNTKQLIKSKNEVNVEKDNDILFNDLLY